jgi:hypothetical protein
VLTTIAREAAGASGTRHSPRPLLLRAAKQILQNSGPSRREIADLYLDLTVIARSEATKQSILLSGAMDCFASLAMTI